MSQLIKGLWNNLTSTHPIYPFLSQTDTDTDDNGNEPMPSYDINNEPQFGFNHEQLQERVKEIIAMNCDHSTVASSSLPSSQSSPQSTNHRKRRRSSEDVETHTKPWKRRRITSEPQYTKPIGLVRSKTHPTIDPLREAAKMIRNEQSNDTQNACEKDKKSESENSRKRRFAEIEDETDDKVSAEEPQSKRLRLTPYSSREATPILSQSTVESEADAVPRRHFRPNRIKDCPSNAVSSCCHIAILVEKKKRYLKVYEDRFRRVYSKYNIGNNEKIDHWMKLYGGDVDKMDELYRKICNKYDLIPCNKYEGYVEATKNEAEVLKYVKPIPIIAAPPCNDDIVQKERGQTPSANPTPSILPQLSRNDDANDARNSDDDSDSQSTFNAPSERSVSLQMHRDPMEFDQQFEDKPCEFNQQFVFKENPFGTEAHHYHPQNECAQVTFEKEDRLFTIPDNLNTNNYNNVGEHFVNQTPPKSNSIDASFFNTRTSPRKKKNRKVWRAKRKA